MGTIVIVVGWAVGMSDSADRHLDPLEQSVRISVNLGLTVVVPVVALVFAAGALGDARDDGTLVYLWLRPMRRWPVAVGAYAAALVVSVPLTVIPVVATAALIESSGELVTAVAIATTVAVVGYTGLFLLLGSLLKRSIVWGLAYIIIWEGVAAGLGRAAARLSIRGYARSVITDRVGVEIASFDITQGWGIVGPLVAATAAIMLTTWRLNRMDVA